MPNQVSLTEQIQYKLLLTLLNYYLVVLGFAGKHVIFVDN